LFHSFVGINPKEYTRIVRFQKALAQMQHQAGKEINQAQIAYASGYADQSTLSGISRSSADIRPCLC